MRRILWTFSAAMISVVLGFYSDAQAGRNNFEHKNVNFIGGAAATANYLNEANALNRGRQEREDARQAEERSDSFVSSALLSNLVRTAQDEFLSAGPGETGSGNLAGTIYSWVVSATQRIFTLTEPDGSQTEFIIDCGAGGCVAM